jgi:N6-adenosine-specific RNA methylase IME4
MIRIKDIQELPFPNKRYKIIYADPPWDYENKSIGAQEDNYGAAAINQYDTMTVDEICHIPVNDISDKDSVLFLWGTTPLLPESLEVMRSWGFKYKTAFYWRKIMSLGMGYWFRGQIEFMLIGIKGDIKAFHNQKPNIFQSKADIHSRKPREIRGLIDSIADQFNLNPKIELFSRDKIEGWDSWGDEVPKDEQKLLKGI